MDLVLTGCVSESAVLALSKEILYERGTLPVGEIGKVLQELTCASSFLGKLKEKFGGLKKFLERFPNEFVICTDHPFNPHVFVKKALKAEEMEMVLNGIVPLHLTAKFRKVILTQMEKLHQYYECFVSIYLFILHLPTNSSPTSTSAPHPLTPLLLHIPSIL
jgi:hypothetical protein